MDSLNTKFFHRAFVNFKKTCEQGSDGFNSKLYRNIFFKSSFFEDCEFSEGVYFMLNVSPAQLLAMGYIVHIMWRSEKIPFDENKEENQFYGKSLFLEVYKRYSVEQGKPLGEEKREGNEEEDIHPSELFDIVCETVRSFLKQIEKMATTENLESMIPQDQGKQEKEQESGSLEEEAILKQRELNFEPIKQETQKTIFHETPPPVPARNKVRIEKNDENDLVENLTKFEIDEN